MANTLNFLSNSAQETIDFAKRLSRLLKKGDVVGLVGNLGSGKTTFIKGLAKGLGFKNRVNSPSFVLLKIYKKRITLYHFDLYRLNSLKDLEDIGYEDFISDSGICVIEWADRARSLLPKNFLEIKMLIKGRNRRMIKIIKHGKRYNYLVKRLS